MFNNKLTRRKKRAGGGGGGDWWFVYFTDFHGVNALTLAWFQAARVGNRWVQSVHQSQCELTPARQALRQPAGFGKTHSYENQIRPSQYLPNIIRGGKFYHTFIRIMFGRKANSTSNLTYFHSSEYDEIYLRNGLKQIQGRRLSQTYHLALTIVTSVLCSQLLAVFLIIFCFM